MRKTKIVGTIGPASNSRKVFIKMCEAGLNVARLNFSHGTHEEHLTTLDMIKKVREELNIPIAFTFYVCYSNYIDNPSNTDMIDIWIKKKNGLYAVYIAKKGE